MIDQLVINKDVSYMSMDLTKVHKNGGLIDRIKFMKVRPAMKLNISNSHHEI